jgi:hypothetical protein
VLDKISFHQFSQIDDPHKEGKIDHSLSKIFVITLTVTLAGADNWAAIVEFAKPREERLSSLVDMSNGIPSHDTLERVFSLISPIQFQKSFIEWVQDIIATTQKI